MHRRKSKWYGTSLVLVTFGGGRRLDASSRVLFDLVIRQGSDDAIRQVATESKRADATLLGY